MKKKFRNSKLLIVLLLLLISVGFAMLSATIAFNGNFNVKAAKWDVHFENVVVSNGSVTGDDVVLAPEISSDEKGNDTKVTYGVILDKPTDYYEFTVDVVNKGNVNAMVDSVDITELTNEQKVYLDYVVTYSDGNEIKEGDTLNVDETKTIKVKVSYKESVIEIPSDADTAIELSAGIVYVQGDKDVDVKITNDYLYEYRFKKMINDNNPSKVIFTDCGVSDLDDSKYVDFSDDETGEIYGWMDEDIMYVSAKEPKVRVRAPGDLSYFFRGIDYLPYLDLSTLDTSNSTNFQGMFSHYGNEVLGSLVIKGLDKFDTSNVTDMAGAFNHTGFKASVFKVEGLDNWDVSNVKKFNSLFTDTGYRATNWSIGDLSKWNVSNGELFYEMFYCAGRYATHWSVGDLSGWRFTNATDITNMFESAAYSSDSFDLGDLSNWDISHVYKLNALFLSAAPVATHVYIGDISKWNTSHITNMTDTFDEFARNSTDFYLDLSGWDVSNVTEHSYFNDYVTDKIKAPIWK